MRKLKAVETTEAERKAVAEGVAAVRSALARFHHENQGAVCFAPAALIHIDTAHAFFRLTLAGYPSPVGASLDSALAMLASNSDADKKRAEAAALRVRADEIDAEAAALERAQAGDKDGPAPACAYPEGHEQ